MATNKEKQVREEEQPKNQINLNPIRRLFANPREHIEPYVTKGQVVADLGCNTGYYTLALAECVGPEGMVYAVDLNENAIRGVEEKAAKSGYRNIEAHASSAADLSFIKDGSVDFILANGLLCSMADHRESAVNEIRRILSLYRITGEERYRDIALQVAKNQMNCQLPDGSFQWKTPGQAGYGTTAPSGQQRKLTNDDFDIACEFVVWLSLIGSNLLPRDTA